MENMSAVIAAAKAGVAEADMNNNFTAFEVMAGMSYMSVDVVEFMIEKNKPDSAAKFGGATVLTIMKLLQTNAPDEYNNIMNALNNGKLE